MIPTSVRVCDSKILYVRSDIRVRVCVGVFKFCVHIRMDRCLCSGIVFMSIEIHTDNITTISIQIPDRLFLNKIRTDRHRTAFFLKIRTKSRQLTEPRQTESGEIDTGQKIWTESRQKTDTGHDFLENPDKNETRTVLSADVWSGFAANYIIHMIFLG